MEATYKVDFQLRGGWCPVPSLLFKGQLCFISWAFLSLVFFRVIGKVLKAVFLDLVFNLKVKFCIFFQTCI